MPIINFHELDRVENEKLVFAIIVSRYKGKWVFVRVKKRRTWEMPAGHREENEDINHTAIRELKEETGAERFKITPVCIYSVTEENVETFGQLFFAEIDSLGKLPNLEIAEIKLFDNLPRELTYPLVQPKLFQRIVKFYENL